MDDQYNYFRDAEFVTEYKYSYENSYYRNFLLNNFSNVAFSEEEKEKISAGSAYSVHYLNDEEIRDAIMINTDLDDNKKEIKQSQGTDYAKAMGLFVASNGNSAYWVYGAGVAYLPGGSASCECVTENGIADSFGSLVNQNNIGVRPMIELKLLDAASYCPYCEDIHGDGFFEKIVEIFHKIFYWLADLF